MDDKKAIISGSDISFSYDVDGYISSALDGISVQIKTGEMIAILGQNGSGKSTIAKHFNALLAIQKGELVVAGINVKNEKSVWELRRICGMVFQNPDNQFVSSIIEEDIAFGLENYEVPREIIAKKVESVLKLVGMEGCEKRAPHTLSGGQKQRIALAGVLALEPDIIVFDEVTAMLDPEGRKEILDAIKSLHRSGKTIILITHYIEEAVFADKVCLMQNGKILGYGTPHEVLTDMELMDSAGLIPPVPIKLYYDLNAAGIKLSSCPLTNEELVEEICRLN